MVYNPQIHHRRTIRLKGYDYSQSGAYFVTICIKNRECLLGKVVNGKMIINPCGEMIAKWVYKIEDKFNGIKISIFVVMPNHFHAIITNAGHIIGTNNAIVGAAPRGRPVVDPTNHVVDPTNHVVDPADHVVDPTDHIIGTNNAIVGAAPSGRPIVDPTNHVVDPADPNDNIHLDDCVGQQGGPKWPPLRLVVGWFKTMTTNEYFRGVKALEWKPVDKTLWQRNYYEHIIRNEQSYNEITEYIRNNPKRWQTDKLYMKE